MHMTFYWGWDATILFSSWQTPESSAGPLVGSCLALMAFCIIYQWLLSFRYEREAAMQKLKKAELEPINKDGCDLCFLWPRTLLTGF